MTGWRCGWTIGPAAVDRRADTRSRAMRRRTSRRSRRRPSLAALTGSQDAGRRRCWTSTGSAATACTQWLTRGSAASRCVKPAGAFYLFPDLSEVHRGRRLQDVQRLRAGAARRVARRRHAGRGVRCAGVRADVLRDVDGEPARRQPTAPRVRRAGTRLRRRAPDRMSKVVAVIGASSNRRKFGNRAVRAYLQQGYTRRADQPARARNRRPAGVPLGARRARADRHGVVLCAAGDWGAGHRRSRRASTFPKSG